MLLELLTSGLSLIIERHTDEMLQPVIRLVPGAEIVVAQQRLIFCLVCQGLSTRGKELMVVLMEKQAAFR